MVNPGFRLKRGLKGTAQIVVDKKHLATEFIQPSVESLGTPVLINLMNLAAFNAVKDYLPQGYTTVCTYVNVRHVAATPPGMAVTAEAVLEEIEGNRLIFRVKAYDEAELVGEGVIERWIVEEEKFLQKVRERKSLLIKGSIS
ncbi:MAG: hypothetical protein H5T91_03205 [Synergistetes bacterium]|nr:MAG: Thioesterase superfamily [bacterium 42_11]MBC7331425.1 hypothetical protein [Synergistota bacterium]MDK2871415.1 fluoroacetyl-CoA thioesterase [bacterium]